MDTKDDEHFEVDKMLAAHRQLNVAIRLHFEGDDPLAVVTLAGAAATVFTDLVEHRCPERSWDRRAQAVMSLAPKEYFAIFRQAPNFLKHADQDPDGVLRWSREETEGMIMAAVMNAGELDLLSLAASVFQYWYIAKHRAIFTPGFDPSVKAVQLFPGMDKMCGAEQRALGAQHLREEYAQLAREIAREKTA